MAEQWKSKGRIIYAVALSLTLGLLLTGCSSTLSEMATKLQDSYQAQRNYEDGLRRYSAKDYAGAILLFQRSLTLDPTFDDAQAYLAWSYYQTGEYVQATRHFRLAIARQPKWEGLYNGLGWSRYRVGRYHLALEAFRAALDLDPRYRDAAVGLGYSLFELGRYAEALPHLELLTREGEGSAFQSAIKDVEDVRSRLAWSLYYVGDFARARDQFRKGVAVRPDWYGLHNGLGWTELSLGDRAEARVHFRRALQLKEDLADAEEGLMLAGRD